MEVAAMVIRVDSKDEYQRRLRRKDHEMTTTTYSFTGMTCAHCVNSVSTEVSALPGVSRVEVDLATGAVAVTSEQPLEPEAVRTAVEEAGYQLAAA